MEEHEYLEINDILTNIFYLKKEYKNILSLYSEELIMKKCYTLKVKDDITQDLKENIEKRLTVFFEPSLCVISKMIDAGIIEKECSSHSDEAIKSIIYDSWDKLFIYKSIKYNLEMSFIMQLYLLLEQKVIIFFNKYFKQQNKNLFSIIRYCEKNGCYFDEEIKKKFDLYRNIINVYKHGEGESYNILKNNNAEKVMNSIDISNGNTLFLFKLEYVNFDDLYENCIGFIDNIKKL